MENIEMIADDCALNGIHKMPKIKKYDQKQMMTR